MPRLCHRIRFVLATVAVACATSAMAASAKAAAVSYTLDQLIGDGTTGVVIGDKQFYDFSYIAAPPGGTGVPTAGQITVTPTTGSPEGLRFSFNWTASAGDRIDSVISYGVHTLTTVPQNFISGVGLDFNGTATGSSGANSSLTNASVVEQIMDLHGNDLGKVSVIDFGTGDPRNRDSSLFTLASPARDVFVSKDISVVSNGGGTATITFVDNTFPQVPEPASLGVLAMGGLLMLRRRAR